MTKKLIVVGAGPVGCLAAIALANMGWEVEIYDTRPGIPLPLSPPLSTFSFNSHLTRYAPAFFAGSRPTTID
jgi:2-polyprenyl-6-methoxyphenol hydroxylase-like FAD-dependent oxidoreductase